MSYLTTVTLEVEVLIESHHSDSFLTAWGWNDGLITAHTQRGEAPGRNVLSQPNACTFPLIVKGAYSSVS